MGSKVNGINQIRTAECHPEKAGVGGSIPSLATTSFQRLSAISVSAKCLPGVQLGSKVGFCSAIASRPLAPLAPIMGNRMMPQKPPTQVIYSFECFRRGAGSSSPGWVRSLGLASQTPRCRTPLPISRQWMDLIFAASPIRREGHIEFGPKGMAHQS